MELEVIAMAAGLFGAPPDAGSMTSGGTESIFLAVQVARDQARQRAGHRRAAAPHAPAPPTRRSPRPPSTSTSSTSWSPSAHDGRADVAATADAVTDRTGLIVGSAPCYPYGVIDPIPELAALAADRGILFHTDACLGGWLLPFWERLGEPVAAVGLPRARA